MTLCAWQCDYDSGEKMYVPETKEHDTRTLKLGMAKTSLNSEAWQDTINHSHV